MNKKGQALIEFIIIMPVLAMLILAFVDYLKIASKKNELEYEISNVLEKKEASNKCSYNADRYVCKDNVSINSFLNLIIGSNYEVYVERVIYE